MLKLAVNKKTLKLLEQAMKELATSKKSHQGLDEEVIFDKVKVFEAK